jgi:MoaA/NifB/PqqE/SkfB family radical SAM enzyme
LSSSADAPLALLEPLVGGTVIPLSLDLNTLNRCNASCIMCPFAVKYDDHGESLPPYYRLTVAEYDRITAGLRIQAAHFVGAYAEPLMNKEIFALVARAKAQGAETAITSNGSLLSRAFSEKLVDAGLDLLTISVHGATKETAEAIMRGVDFDRVLENIRTLQAVKAARGLHRPALQINYVGQRLNVGELTDFVRLAASLRVPTVQFIHLLDGAAEVDASASLVHYPDLLARSVAAARAIAEREHVFLNVSPAYQSVIDAHEGARTGPAGGIEA